MSSRKPAFDYKKMSAELDEILFELESAELDVEASLNLYQRGMDIAEQLEAYLKSAENKVSKLKLPQRTPKDT